MASRRRDFPSLLSGLSRALRREGIVFIFSTTRYERQAVDRAVTVELGGLGVPFAMAEDLILHKLFAGRARDLEDAESVARLQGRAVDWTYLEECAERFSEVPGREDLPKRLADLRRGRTSGG